MREYHPALPAAEIPLEVDSKARPNKLSTTFLHASVFKCLDATFFSTTVTPSRGTAPQRCGHTTFFSRIMSSCVIHAYHVFFLHSCAEGLLSPVHEFGTGLHSDRKPPAGEPFLVTECTSAHAAGNEVHTKLRFPPHIGFGSEEAILDFHENGCLQWLCLGLTGQLFETATTAPAAGLNPR